MEKPVRVARLRRMKMEIKYFPYTNRAWMSWRIPVFGPHVHMYATGIVDRRVKKRMMRDASLNPSPKLKVPTIPVVMLGLCQSLVVPSNPDMHYFSWNLR